MCHVGVPPPFCTPMQQQRQQQQQQQHRSTGVAGIRQMLGTSGVTWVSMDSRYRNCTGLVEYMNSLHV
jgi:hypothetical protein